MTQRYFVASLPKLGGIVPLSPIESQHAIRVMRLKIGESVILFDGRGSESLAIVSDLNRRECVCEANPAALVSREAATKLHLAIALPKNDRAKEMLERLTELGVASVAPIISQRCQRPPSPTLLEKLPRIIIEASKQCGRNSLLKLQAPTKFADYLNEKKSSGATKWILHTNADPPSLQNATHTDEVDAAIGPEGGWTDEEVQSAIDHQFQPIHLGSRILRIETAAAAIAAICCCGH